ncbi:lipopolysaccharide biosynthesis protein [Phocaeicola vulgatus]|uniref:lipopolysaccharide biosynthesis protein n=1 Tax=Phocaeicola vulgatus TaxID=821 RepID=UPI0018982D3B|nr:hypothetical protein [Phocaeicola vulgatus]
MKFQYIKDKVSAYFTKGNERSVAVKKNIAVSLVLKCISILVSLQVVPLTIGYVNPTKYGIWLTLSSIIAWLSYFDLGFAHGFRNRFAEAKAKGDMKLAKEYVSTTYAVLFLLFSVILLITLVVNNYLDWSRILNIDPVYKDELSLVFGLLACFFCLNIVASVFTTMLTADQKPALASLISTSGQVLAFACVYVLTKTTKGSLSALAVSFSLSFCMAIYVLCQTGGNMYMFLINGTSKIRLQLIIYLSFALVSIPLMKYCCKYYGIEGILIVPTTVFILQAFIGRVQILKMINGTAKGIWLK